MRFGIGALENAKQTIASMTTTNLTHGSHFIRTRQIEGFFVCIRHTINWRAREYKKNDCELYAGLARTAAHTQIRTSTNSHTHAHTRLQCASNRIISRSLLHWKLLSWRIVYAIFHYALVQILME